MTFLTSRLESSVVVAMRSISCDFDIWVAMGAPCDSARRHIAEKPGKNRPSESFHTQNEQFSAEKVPIGHFQPSRRVSPPVSRALAKAKVGRSPHMIRLRDKRRGSALKARPTAW